VKIKEILELVTGYAGSGKAELVQKAYALLTATLPAESSPGPIPPLEKAVEAAGVLANLESRSESVAAALLVDCPEHGCATDLIEEQVGEGVARLVAGVRRMRNSPYLASLDNRSRSNRARSEIYYAFVDALEDPQLVLIGLAHQLSRIRRAGAFPQDEQERIGHEVQLIYAPLADRLGIWRLKWELEDRAFRIIRPEEYHEIAQALNQHRAEREAGIQQMAGTLTTELDKLEIQAEVSGRPKHISSIYRKMQRKGVPFEAIYDVRALRVLTGDIPTCYQVLGVVHRLWTPIPGQFDDYVAVPKSNGYRSLHTAATDVEGKTLEVQIRTREMHATAELGIAAHWRYKEHPGSQKTTRKKRLAAERAMDEKLVWLRSLLEDPKESSREWTRVEPHRAAFAADAGGVFVFTPMNDMIRLPSGATPIDFAYRIHTELGHRCSGARVNDRIVPLDYRLISGDRVEIITRKRGGPNINWLSLKRGFVRTRDAQKKIGAWFRRQEREKNIVRGHDILEHTLAKLGKSSLPFDAVARSLEFDRTDEMLTQIGADRISAEKIRSVLADPGRLSKDDLARQAETELVTDEEETKTLIERRAGSTEVTAGRGLQVASTVGLYSRLAKCCYPVPPEQIVGYVTRGYGVTIHLADCPNLGSARDQERVFPAHWGEANGQRYPVMVIVEALNRQGLMADIEQVIAIEHLDINEARAKKKAHWAVFELLLEVADAEQLNRILVKLERTKGVRLVYRRKG
jgi:GTP pyrophosphokinase